jgi:hypothetical protein
MWLANLLKFYFSKSDEDARATASIDLPIGMWSRPLPFTSTDTEQSLLNQRVLFPKFLVSDRYNRGVRYTYNINGRSGSSFAPGLGTRIDATANAINGANSANRTERQ